MKGIRVTKIFKEIKLKRVWTELEAKKKGFRRQSFTTYMRLTIDFM